MTNQQLLARIDRLGEYAAASLRCADHERKHGSNMAPLFRGNAKCYNEAAGLFALDLGLAQFIDDNFRPDDERSDAPRSNAPRSDALPDHIENFLHSFTAAIAPAAESGAVAVC